MQDAKEKKAALSQCWRGKGKRVPVGEATSDLKRLHAGVISSKEKSNVTN
jgi:hypothetical protein